MSDFELYLGNCLGVLRDFPAESVDSIVTDPPYGLSFMGRKWDYDVPSTEIWTECLRVLKPGGNLLCFAGTRTQHRMVSRVVGSGFVMQDAVLWAYGCLSEDTEVLTKDGWVYHREAIGKVIQVYDIVTKERKWETPSQWYTYEVENDVAYILRSDDTDQVVSKGHRCLVYSDDSLGFTFSDELRSEEVIPVFDGNGALHKTRVSVSEISYSGTFWCPTVSTGAFVARRNGKVFITGNSGFPKSLNISKNIDKSLGVDRTEVIGTKLGRPGMAKDGSNQSFDSSINTYGSGGILSTDITAPATDAAKQWEGYGTSLKPAHEIVSIYTKLAEEPQFHADFKRLYYCSKASKKERNLGLVDRVSNHPTVKPLKLMEQLCKLATPPRGTILDPFMGSGTTGIAALNLGFNFIGIEMGEEYFDIAQTRINSLHGGSQK